MCPFAKAIRILGIETSCDETGVAIVQAHPTSNGIPALRIIANAIASQIETHKDYGGVVPSLAAREHVTNLPIMLEQAFRQRGKEKRKTQSTEKSKVNGRSGSAQHKRWSTIVEEIDAVAVTQGPGLMPCLLNGLYFAKALAWKWDVPLIGVDHMEGHLYSALLEQNKATTQEVRYKTHHLFPAIALIVSGGHTMLVLVRTIGDHTVLGETVDDAAGEAFDKVARMLDLGYPGGPAIGAAAEDGNPDAFDFPRPMIDSGDYQFSFSGLKTAVLYTLREKQHADDQTNGHAKERRDVFSLSDDDIADVSASFQQAVVDVLVAKTMQAAEEYRARSVWLSGGVAANKRLRRTLKQKTAAQGATTLLIPPTTLCTDNAAMIAGAGALRRLTADFGDERNTVGASTQHTLQPWKKRA